MLVRMVHPTVGERLVPDLAVERYKANGWKLKTERKKPKTEPPTEPPKTEQAEAPESGAFSFPEHKEES